MKGCRNEHRTRMPPLSEVYKLCGMVRADLGSFPPSPQARHLEGGESYGVIQPTVLDWINSIVFVYLLLAIVCTIFNEGIAGIASVHAKTLAPRASDKTGRKTCRTVTVTPTAHKRRSALVLVLLVCLVSFLAGCAGSGNLPVPKNLTAIRHTVFIINENHTFDNYFGTFPGADGTTTGLISTGQWMPLSPMPDRYQGDILCNGWDCSLQAIDIGKMDKFDVISGGTWGAYTQATQQQIPNYWACARRPAIRGQFKTAHQTPFRTVI
jgi:hypothetical protein